MRRPDAPSQVPCLLILLLSACTGLAAGPEVSQVTPVPASRDSAWVRARRALSAEVFTLDVQDSLGGRITAMRYPGSTAKPGTAEACRVQLALSLEGAADRAQVASTSRWIAPDVTSTSNPAVCEEERQETLDRILQVVTTAPQ